MMAWGPRAMLRALWGAFLFNLGLEKGSAPSSHAGATPHPAPPVAFDVPMVWAEWVWPVEGRGQCRTYAWHALADTGLCIKCGRSRSAHEEPASPFSGRVELPDVSRLLDVLALVELAVRVPCRDRPRGWWCPRCQALATVPTRASAPRLMNEPICGKCGAVPIWYPYNTPPPPLSVQELHELQATLDLLRRELARWGWTREGGAPGI